MEGATREVRDVLFRGPPVRRRRPVAAAAATYVYTPSPPTTPSAALFSAAAQPEESFGVLPFVALFALASARLSDFFAFLSSFAAFFAGLVAAWSIRFSALVRFAVTLPGMV